MEILEMRKPEDSNLNASSMECGANGQIRIDKPPC
jgi:hypothetical protein